VFAVPGRQRKEVDEVPRYKRFHQFCFYECAVKRTAAEIAQSKKAGEIRRPLDSKRNAQLLKAPGSNFCFDAFSTADKSTQSA
jgi:hypothetical protein